MKYILKAENISCLVDKEAMTWTLVVGPFSGHGSLSKWPIMDIGNGAEMIGDTSEEEEGFKAFITYGVTKWREHKGE